MPELPEVEVLRRSLESRLVGRRIEGIEVLAPALREPLDRRALRRRLAGRTVVSLRRRGKYLLVDVEGGSTLVVHLGMSGRLTLAPAETPREPHEHLAFRLDRGEKLRLRDPRRFGLAFAAATAGLLERDPHFVHLGREPALDGADLEQPRTAAGAGEGVLMDATRIVGGNICATEASIAAIHPARSVAPLAGALGRLAHAVVDVSSRRSAKAGRRSTTTDGAGAPASSRSPSAYGRAGEPCPRCGRSIRRLVQSNRSSFYCPGCQR
jgi:formamidopyrimidine-DNA glycosylase